MAGPWEWPPFRRVERLDDGGGGALTLSAGWGTAAAPARDEPFGRAGPWAKECGQIEDFYGADRTVHVSFEEFARTLTSRKQTAERWREGGLTTATIRRRLREQGPAEIAQFDRAYRKFRAFERSNVLHLYTTFRYDATFARTFPESVQTGPLWPRIAWPSRALTGSRPTWVWYASPSTSTRLIPALNAGLSTAVPVPKLVIRTPWPIGRVAPQRNVTVLLGPMRPERWRRQFASAQVRIVTGSRTLLEGLELGGPFLYFNGLLGSGPAARRHRPEKIASLLRLWASQGVSRALRRDLSDFARGRRVSDVARRAASGRGPWKRFPRRVRPIGFRPPYDDAGALLIEVARQLRRDPGAAAALVSRVRARTLSVATKA